jgi:ADP-ribose pyrophosphatase YjhB (NUDIX family)
MDDIRYCPHCGTSLENKVQFGRMRPGCPACGWIFFEDPKVAAVALIKEGNRVLLVRRANEPHRGLWTLPAGFVDAGEDPKAAAVRECLEETGLKIRITELFDVLYGQEHPRGAHIMIVYHGEIIGGDIQPADDVDAAAFFDVNDLPELAFDTTRKILR